MKNAGLGKIECSMNTVTPSVTLFIFSLSMDYYELRGDKSPPFKPPFFSIYKTGEYHKHILNINKISVYDTYLAKEIYGVIQPYFVVNLSP